MIRIERLGEDGKVIEVTVTSEREGGGSVVAYLKGEESRAVLGTGTLEGRMELDKAEDVLRAARYAIDEARRKREETPRA